MALLKVYIIYQQIKNTRVLDKQLKKEMIAKINEMFDK